MSFLAEVLGNCVPNGIDLPNYSRAAYIINCEKRLLQPRMKLNAFNLTLAENDCCSCQFSHQTIVFGTN